MKNNHLISTVSLLCIIASSVIWISAISTSTLSHIAMEEYWQENNIQIQRIKIPSYDKVELSAFVIRTTPIVEKPDGIVPLIIHMNGINSQKEDHFDFTLNLAKLGFLVVVVECRGHGQSSGRVSLYGQEPGDIPEVINYMQMHYPEANTTHVAVSGYSYGAGTMLRAQALDDRIYCEALFHPLSNLSFFLTDVPLPTLVGPRWFMPVQYGNTTQNVLDARYAYGWLTPENTKNLLLIQGDVDDTVYPEDTRAIYDKVNGDQRIDIQLVMRPGLGHGANERDPISQNYALVWLKYYYWNQSIDRTNLNNEINYFDRYEYRPPIIPNLSNLIWGGVILCIIGLWIGLRFRIKTEDEITFIPIIMNQTDEGKTASSLILRYFGALWGTSIITGIICMLVDPNILWSVIIIIPSLSAGIFLVSIPHLFEYIQKLDLKRYLKRIIQLNTESIIYIIPLLIGCAIYDNIAIETWQRTIWPWIPLTFIALLVVPLILSAIYFPVRVILDNSPKNQKWKSIYLLPFWIATLYIYTIFVPMPQINAIPFSAWLIPAIFGLLFFLLSMIFRVVHAIWGKILPIFFLIALTACIALLDGAYNLLI